MLSMSRPRGDRSSSTVESPVVVAATSTSEDLSSRSNDLSSQDNSPAFGYDQVFAPWATRRYPLSLQGLHEELIDVYKWLRPSQIETQIRFQVFEKVVKVIRERWHELDDLRVSVFGSLRTRLFLPSSDIDVLAEFDTTKMTREAASDVIKGTREAFANNAEFSKVTALSNTPVPIIKVVDRDTLISIDISFNTKQGVRAAEYFEKVKHEFPMLEPMVFFLKQYLSERRLNDTYSGGLSSYGLILMVQHFFQTNYEHLRWVPVDDPRVNLGILLLRFLEIFALEFNYSDLTIKVKERCYGRKSDEPNRTNYLSIEDPLSPENDVGRSTYNIQNVRLAFERALTSLWSVFITDRPYSAQWRQHYPGSMLGHLLTFSPSQLEYRLWLKVWGLGRFKGFTMKWTKSREPIMVQSEPAMLLTSALDLEYVKRLNDFLKFPKRIDIVHPDDALGREKILTDGKTHSEPLLRSTEMRIGEEEKSENDAAARTVTIEASSGLEKEEEFSDNEEQQMDAEATPKMNGDLSSDGWEDVRRAKAQAKRAANGKRRTKNAHPREHKTANGSISSGKRIE